MVKERGCESDGVELLCSVSHQYSQYKTKNLQIFFFFFTLLKIAFEKSCQSKIRSEIIIVSLHVYRKCTVCLDFTVQRIARGFCQT